MTSPIVPEQDPRKHDTGESRSTQARPAGESGGHTVQDWEQPTAAQPGETAVAVKPSRTAPGLSDVEDADVPSPPTTPVYLRSVARGEYGVAPAPAVASPAVAAPVVAAPAVPFPAIAVPAVAAVAAVAAPVFDARLQTITAQSAALVDSITLGLADALAVSLRPIVASTVEALIPMILSLGSVPDDRAGSDVGAAVPAKGPPVPL